MPRSPFGEDRDQFPGHLYRYLEVDPKRTIDLLGGEAVEPPGGGQCRVGDEDVDVARLGEQGEARARLGEVADDRPMPVSCERCSELVELLLLAGAQNQMCAARGDR